MSKIILVMRHGKAERADGGQADIDRKLTEAGTRSLAATLAGSLALWPAGKTRPEIWTSPAVRARQTAELLAQALRSRSIKPASGPKIVESLWTADKQALLEEVSSSNSAVIALVGHNPLSEELVEALTGSDIRFATGAIAAVEMMEGTGQGTGPKPAGRLLWFAQGPVSQRWKTLVAMEGRLAEAMSAVQRCYDAFFADPADIETMHALRVSIRKARSLVAFAKPWQDSRQNAEIQDDLRTVVRLTSRQRELDVMWKHVAEEGGFSAELADFCAGQASAERSCVLESLAEKPIRKRLARAAGNMTAIRWKRRCVEEGLAPDEVRAHFDHMAAKLRANLETLDLAAAERTHDVRKQAKRVRYSAEHFKEILGDDAVGIAKDMVAHQDSLGAICDVRANIEIIGEFLADDLPEPISWELALLRARFETFLYSTLRDARGVGGAPQP